MDKKKLNSLRSIAEEMKIDNMYNSAVERIASLYNNTRYEFITLRRDLLTFKYTTDPIYKTLVEQPILDGLRGDLKIETKLLNEEELDELYNYLDKNNIKKVIKDLFCWNRLFGGAGLIIEVLGQNLSSPLNIKMIKQGDKLNFFAADRWELLSSLNNDNDKDKINNYFVVGDNDLFYYGHKVNADRCITLTGIEAPSLIRNTFSGWGFSCLETLVIPSNEFSKLRNLIYEIVDEAKIDVYKINGLNDNAITNNENLIKTRIEVVNTMKNFLNAVVLDNEDEFQQKQLNFGGLTELLEQYRLEICSAMKMPIIKVFGVPTAGFSSGDVDLEMYNSVIESEVRPDILRVYKQVIKYICKALFGIVVYDLDLSFPSLRLLTDEQLENIKDKQLKRALDLFDRKQLTSKELAEYNKNNEIITIETKALNGELPEFTEVEANDFNQEEENDFNNKKLF